MSGLMVAGLMKRSFTFGYANARAKAMKTTLIARQDMEAMAEAKTLEGVNALLEKTNYREDLVSSALEGSTPADRIELACTKNFSRILKKIRKIAPKEARGKLVELFEKYDVENIKAILIAKHVNESREKTENLITDTGLLSKGLINSLLDAKGIKDVASLLGGTPYGKEIWKKIPEYEKSGQMSILTNALDSYYSRKIPQIAKNPYGDEKIIASMLKAEADSRNISNIIRAMKAGMEPEKIAEIIMPEGNITKERLMQAINSKSAEEAMKSLSDKIGSEKSIEEYKKTGSLIAMELELEKGLLGKGVSVLRASVLSLGAIAGLLYLKEQEVTNIRKIVRAKEFGVPDEKIMEMLAL